MRRATATRPVRPGALAGLLFALAVGAVVPAAYAGWAYLNLVRPLQRELKAAEGRGAVTRDRLSREFKEAVVFHAAAAGVLWAWGTGAVWLLRTRRRDEHRK